MKAVTLSAIALTIAITGFTGSAMAQDGAEPSGNRTEPAGKLFFEGDIVRHALDGQVGPFCVLQNQYKRGEAVAWRIRILQPDGSVATDSVLKNVEVELGDGERIPAEFRTHGRPATDKFWSLHWDIPMDYPTGSLGYKVHATMQDDTVVTWQPFNRPATQLTIIEGEPMMEAAAQ